MNAVLLVAALVAVAAAIPATPVAAGKGACDGCKTVVGFIETWLAQNKTAPAIEKDLTKVCDMVPGISAVCASLVDIGIPKIIGWIEAKESPTEVCDKIHLCKNTTADVTVRGFRKVNPALKALRAVPKVADGECAGCKYVVGTVESFLHEEQTIEQIEKSVDLVCSIVPGLESTCDAVVQAGIPALVAWIEEHQNATVVCQELGLCADAAKPLRTIAKPKPRAPLDDCSECQTVIGAIEHWLSQNTSVNTIEHYLEDWICDLIPSYEATCDAIFREGVPAVITWIEDNEDPKTVCTQLGVCSNDNAARPTRFGHGRVKLSSVRSRK